MDTFRSILVHIDASPRSAQRLAIAREIARQHDAAALIALLALELRPPPLPLPMGTYLPDTANLPVVARVDPEQRQRARAMFDEALGSGDPAMTWAEAPDDPPRRAMVQASLYADLLVLGQHDPQDPSMQDVPRDLVESVVLESGKPALIVPRSGPFSSMGRNVLVAWKPTRECARAVAGALPFMREARRVHVLSWGKDSFAPAETTFGVVRYLRWHGIEATAQRHEDVPDDLGEVLLRRAADEASDLLVLGCYGHHRLRELLLGGVTRTVLRAMTLPVLTAH